MRTHWRMLVTRRRLLEWTPSSEQDRRDRTTLGGFVRGDVGRPGRGRRRRRVTCSARTPAALPVAAPFLLLWLVSPVLAWWISRPTRAARRKAHASDQIDFLRKLARRTWAYFETFVGPADHWLPPDNYQEVPVGTLAHRTSPTNMGMALLADLAAYDFGYLPAGTTGRAHDQHVAHDAIARAVPRPFLQLVRHAIARAAVAALHFVGRQRKPGRPSADVASRAVRAARSTGFSSCGCSPASSTPRACSSTRSAPTFQRSVVQLVRDLDSAYDARPATAAAAHRWLDRLAAEIAAVDRAFRRPGGRRKGRPSAVERSARVGAGTGRRNAKAAVGGIDAVRALAAAAGSRGAAGRAPRPGADPDAARAGASDADAVPRIERLRDAATTDRRAGATGRRGAGARRRQRARAGAHRGDRSRIAAQCDGSRAHGIRLPLRPHAPLVRGRLQRRRAPARRKLLRSPRLGGAAFELRRHRAGPGSPGELVRAGTAAGDRRATGRSCCRGAARCSST